MICELERLIELGNLIGKNTAGEVEVQFHIYTAGKYRDGLELETWIFFFDKDNITASYCYRNSAVVLNILTMMFNESREESREK